MIEKIYTLLLVVLLGFSSCAYDEISNNIDSDFINGSDYMQIHMNLPDLDPFEIGRSSTRGMDDDAEKFIDSQNFTVLAIKKDENGKEVVDYQAIVHGDISNEGVVTVKIQRSKSDADVDKYQFVLIANHDTPELSDKNKERESKDSFLSKLTFDAKRSWNASDKDYDPIPMWGQTEYVTVKQNMAVPKVDMTRALARIDVGMKFISSEGKYSDIAEGLDYFKINKVGVYRTYENGYVVPQKSDIKYDNPYMGSFKRLKDESPLEYKIGQDVNQYVREIYLPEADVPSNPTNNNMHCIVVGGKYNGSDETTYYRLDFASEDKASKVRDYLPILRNHRYIFNIIKVHGPGFLSPSEALESTGSLIEYEIIDWDESITNVQVKGKYYFGLDQSILEFEADGKGEKSFAIKTNLPSLDEVELEWESGNSEYFEAVLDGSTVKVTGKNKANETNETIIDTLLVKSGPFELPVVITQKYINFKYILNCESVKVGGEYIYGQQLTSDNKITLTIKAEDNSIIDQTYKIMTDTVNGIYFIAEGVFSSIIQEITLEAKGELKPSKSGNSESLKFTINSNSSSGSYCEATVIAVSDIVTIVSLSDKNDVFGFDPAYTEGGTHKILTSKNNFGSNDLSIVKMRGFNFVSTTDYTLSNTNSEAYKLVTGTGLDKKIADIVYLSYPITLLEPEAEVLAKKLINYMDKGGVVISYLDGNWGAYLLGEKLTGMLFDANKNYNITAFIAGAGAGGAGSIYPFPANDLYLTKTNEVDRIKEKHELLVKYEGDPILNGPFGDVRDKQWGEDISQTTNLANMPTEDQEPNLTIYSYNANISNSQTNSSTINNFKAVTSYKYESADRNMIFFGDGGFTSSNDNDISAKTDNYRCPLNWNRTTGFPLPKDNYGRSDVKKSIYNSTVFCNTMAWAIDRSLHLKSKREANAKNNSND